MKRTICILLAALSLLAVLCGCSGSETKKDVSAREVYSAMTALDILPEMYELDESYIDSFYGIDRAAVADSVFSVADDTMLADTAIIVKVSPQGNSGDITAAFENINRQLLFEMEAYNPEQYARAKDAVIGSKGDWVYYLISDDNDALCAAIDSCIG